MDATGLFQSALSNGSMDNYSGGTGCRATLPGEKPEAIKHVILDHEASRLLPCHAVLRNTVSYVKANQHTPAKLRVTDQQHTQAALANQRLISRDPSTPVDMLVRPHQRNRLTPFRICALAYSVAEQPDKEVIKKLYREAFVEATQSRRCGSAPFPFPFAGHRVPPPPLLLRERGDAAMPVCDPPLEPGPGLSVRPALHGLASPVSCRGGRRCRVTDCRRGQGRSITVLGHLGFALPLRPRSPPAPLSTSPLSLRPPGQLNEQSSLVGALGRFFAGGEKASFENRPLRRQLRLTHIRRSQTGPASPTNTVSKQTDGRWSDKGDTATRVKFAIAAKRRAVFSSLCVHLWDFPAATLLLYCWEFCTKMAPQDTYNGSLARLLRVVVMHSVSLGCTVVTGSCCVHRECTALSKHQLTLQHSIAGDVQASQSAVPEFQFVEPGGGNVKLMKSYRVIQRHCLFRRAPLRGKLLGRVWLSLHPLPHLVTWELCQCRATSNPGEVSMPVLQSAAPVDVDVTRRQRTPVVRDTFSRGSILVHFSRLSGAELREHRYCHLASCFHGVNRFPSSGKVNGNRDLGRNFGCQIGRHPVYGTGIVKLAFGVWMPVSAEEVDQNDSFRFRRWENIGKNLCRGGGGGAGDVAKSDSCLNIDGNDELGVRRQPAAQPIDNLSQRAVVNQTQGSLQSLALGTCDIYFSISFRNMLTIAVSVRCIASGEFTLLKIDVVVATYLDVFARDVSPTHPPACRLFLGRLRLSGPSLAFTLRTPAYRLFTPARRPPRRTGFKPRPGHRIFASGNRAGRCRWLAGFVSGISRFLRTSIPVTAPYPPQSPSSALQTSPENGVAPECNGGRNGRSMRKPADQRHRPARFPLEKIRSNPAGEMLDKQVRTLCGWVHELNESIRGVLVSIPVLYGLGSAAAGRRWERRCGRPEWTRASGRSAITCVTALCRSTQVSSVSNLTLQTCVVLSAQSHSSLQRGVTVEWISGRVRALGSQHDIDRERERERERAAPFRHRKRPTFAVSHRRLTQQPRRPSLPKNVRRVLRSPLLQRLPTLSQPRPKVVRESGRGWGGAYVTSRSARGIHVVWSGLPRNWSDHVPPAVGRLGSPAKRTFYSAHSKDTPRPVICREKNGRHGRLQDFGCCHTPLATVFAPAFDRATQDFRFGRLLTTRSWEPMWVIDVSIEQCQNERGGRKGEIPEKTRRPAVSSGTIPMRKFRSDPAGYAGAALRGVCSDGITLCYAGCCRPGELRRDVLQPAMLRHWLLLLACCAAALALPFPSPRDDETDGEASRKVLGSRYTIEDCAASPGSRSSLHVRVQQVAYRKALQPASGFGAQ
ncbi:hypothetical protein PR048_024748 [Dryococelus australis]|uniref:Uncharacterized protein n=1 Tax=Dryococelus australis TaxID=614101 RepID=A0ABQ9GPE2_9NEOP|nr:hypothetical protein PR048_024748 [Dryococelus australis]